MIFSIIDFNKEIDLYSVVSNEGEQRNVTSFQIVKVMLQGYSFKNAYLTKRGFAIKTASGIRYIQVMLDKETQLQIIRFMQEQRRLELEAERQKMLQQEQLRQEQLRQKRECIKKPVIPRKVDLKNSSESKKIQSTSRNKQILYKGTLYLSEEALCKKFNKSIEEFRLLRNKGYSVDEALGIKPLRPETELVSHKQIQRMLDSMAMQRGEF